MDSIPKETLPDDVNFFLLGSQKGDRLPLMSSLWPPVMIVSLYLVFAIKVGPDFMKNRRPLQIKPILLVYNLYQVIINAFLFSRFYTTGAIAYMMKHYCNPQDPAKNPLWIPFHIYGWWFFISRTIDLLDTVFFVLMKKQSHITFLHVFHHAEAVLILFYFTKYTKSEQGPIFCLLNSFVHVIMYAYYFITALGPEYRKYLWWKSHLTKLQLLQFVIVAGYTVGLMIAGCRHSYGVSLFIISQSIIFSVLFGHFYWKTYILRNRQGEQIKSAGAPSRRPEKLKVG